MTDLVMPLCAFLLQVDDAFQIATSRQALKKGHRQEHLLEWPFLGMEARYSQHQHDYLIQIG